MKSDPTIKEAGTVLLFVRLCSILELILLVSDSTSITNSVFYNVDDLLVNLKQWWIIFQKITMGTNNNTF